MERNGNKRMNQVFDSAYLELGGFLLLEAHLLDLLDELVLLGEATRVTAELKWCRPCGRQRSPFQHERL